MGQPKDLRYTREHEWARLEGGLVRVGITDHAVEALGDITLVDLVKPGTKVTAHGHFGDVESVKAVSELFSPIAGEIVEVNGELAGTPEAVNEGPYDKGWMVVIRPASLSDLDALMDATAYEAFLGTL